ncbi:hypothetical protein K490DRAFT_44577 [Saccharata proteae CBS 121410]|uniref:MICOS complex subunit n=1 Tax=Saccharata proteae CBS 121410 TaxID=1314787 RepID=A0A9P4HTF8_9PEZI|nr:hypothetical protein K490DRAFT_44577 [Saccharata proteae CBS 121410]
MAFRPLLRQRAVVPASTAILAAAAALYPVRNAYAEAPAETDLRKPIYDDMTPTAPTEVVAAPAPTAPSTKPSSPTPTDRLAEQISHARLALHSYAASTEDALNGFLTSALRLENNFTSTIASLAPPPSSGEKIMPGAIYVLVAAMAGSIVTRNRNILLRATAPVAVGIGASYAVLPLTTRNVGDLVWKYEQKYPVLADNHLRARERVTRFVETGKAHSQMSVAMLEQKVGGVRETVEEWVRKGR